MTLIYDSNIPSISWENIKGSIYKIYFREDITPVNDTKISCNEYTVVMEIEENDVDEYIENNKESLLEFAKEQDKIKINENKINTMKSSLTNSDYKVLKNLENFIIGIPFESDLSTICANRQLMRDSINNIESDITADEDLLDQAKERKINEVSLISQSTIINGVDFNGKHYKLNTTDQINISALNMMAQMGNKVPYHADNEVCRVFEPEEMIQLASVSTQWVVYHTTYFNLLKHQILEYTTLEEVNAVYYGIELKEEYQQVINAITNIGGDTSEEE
jgi:hypothetical protein